jgi:hypothetical protein
MVANNIDAMPGKYHARLSYRRLIRLVGLSDSTAVAAAPPNSLKRAALEAQDLAKRPKIQSRISFGCDVPFVQIPLLIQGAFEKQERSFRKGDQRVREHYQTAYNCLLSHMGEPLCDLLLMLVLTLGQCVKTPTVMEHCDFFQEGPTKDSENFVVALVTRMLWFLYPQEFPWSKDQGMVLRVPEMLKKIGRELSCLLRGTCYHQHIC